MGLIMNQFILLQNQMQQLNQTLTINNKNNQQELKGIKDCKKWRYVGQIVNGLREGKGIMYYTNGDRYEGYFRNDKPEGKGISYYNNGDRYEGDFRNNKKEGKGIYYYHGDRMMGNYYNGKEIGKHVTLSRNGEVKINNY